MSPEREFNQLFPNTQIRPIHDSIVKLHIAGAYRTVLSVHHCYSSMYKRNLKKLLDGLNMHYLQN